MPVLEIDEFNVADYISAASSGNKDVFAAGIDSARLIGSMVKTPWGVGKASGHYMFDGICTLTVDVGDKQYQCMNGYGWYDPSDPAHQDQSADRVATVQPLPPVGDRPKCRYCDTPLKPFGAYSRQIKPGLRYLGNTRVISVRRNAWRGKLLHWDVTVWEHEGKWGIEGRSHFCSKACGFNYGVAVADQIAKQQVEKK